MFASCRLTPASAIRLRLFPALVGGLALLLFFFISLNAIAAGPAKRGGGVLLAQFRPNIGAARVQAAAKPQRQPQPDQPADAATPENAKATPDQMANRLQQLIRGIFQPLLPRIRLMPGGRNPVFGRRANGQGEPQRANPSDRDFIDSRAPHDAKTEHQLRLAETAVKKGDWKQAIILLQQLLDLPEDSLHRLPDGRWQSVRVAAARLLGNAPPEVLAGYEQQNGGLARQLLMEALQEGDLAGVIRVATQYFHTQAGYQAADYLVTLHQDRAEFGIAAQWLTELVSSKAPFVSTASWRLKGAMIYRQAGQPESAEKLLKTIDAESASVEVAGDSVKPNQWIALRPPIVPETSVALEEWLQIYGTSDRIGVQTGGAPFLMPLWNVPYSSSHLVQQRVDWMMQDLLDQEQPVILAAQPLAINGKVVYRDMRGVRAVDIGAGQSVWESMDGISAERILSGLGNEDGQPSIQVIGMQDPFAGHQAEYHPLTSLMLRDATYNTLSSDGRQVFLIEDHGILSRQQPGFHWGWDGEQPDPYGFSWTTNRLSSYDLETGRPLWTVGGPQTHEAFQLPLAGVYFHGAPTPDGDDLFAIGSKGDETRLWCLDRRTGGLRWSQLVGYGETKMDQDIGRRWIAALPSVSDGIVVCPTTIGWLVAVDRLRKSVLWAVRYSRPSQNSDPSPGNNFTPQRELGEQWGGSAPVISGQHVLYAPAEDNVLICVDLVTGKELWQIPRKDGQYLAGVSGDKAIVVQLSDVTAHSISDGKELWSHDLEETRPSGRGALTSDFLFLPLSTGELRSIRLADGKTESQTFVSAGQPPLGNLLLYRGRLLSLSPQGLTGFRQQSALLAEIQQRKAQNPRDPEALLSESEIELLARKAEKALPLLREIDRNALTPEQRLRLHGDLISALTSVIRQNLADSEQPLAELAAESETPEERLTHLDLSAERFLASGHHRDAFDLYWKLTIEPTSGMVSRTDEPKVLVQRSAWLGGRLRDVWSAAEPEARAQIDARITEAVARAAANDDDARRRLAELIGFHPAARTLVQGVIESRLKAGESAVAELELLRLANAKEKETAVWATWKLGELMEHWKLPSDAAMHYRRLETEFADVRLPTGQTGAEFVSGVRQSGRVSFEHTGRQIAWDERPLKLMQLVQQHYGQPNQDVAPESRWPFFETVDVEFLPNEQRLSVESQVENGFRWLAPLRASATNHYGGYLNVDAVGHALALAHQDVLHLLSPVEKRVLWNVPLEGLAEGGLPPAYANRAPSFAMLAVNRDVGGDSPLFQKAGYTGRVAAATNSYIAVHGRRTLHVLDTRTGAELWRRTGALPQTKVFGSRDIVWLIPPRLDQAVGYRASDGTPLKVDQLGKLLGRTVALVGNDLLLAEQGTGFKFFGLNGTKGILRRYDPLTRTDVWKKEFGAGALVSPLSEAELLVVQSDGTADLVNVTDGTARSMQGLAAKDMASHADCYALADDDRVYLIVNRQANGGYHHFAESLPSIRVNGSLFAWDRRTGELLWKQSLANQHLITERLRNSPVLLFCSREWKQRGNVNFSQLSLVVIHKKSGKRLHESSTPMMYSGLQSVAILPKEHSVELRSYNLRLKLVPAEPVEEARAPQTSD